MISLWILALISLLCISLPHRVVVNLKLVEFQRDKLQCLYIAKAAVQKAISVLEQDTTSDTDMLNELWSNGYGAEKGPESYIFKEVEIGEGRFSISYLYDGTNSKSPVYLYGMSDENRKININSASSELLVSLFSTIGAEDPQGLAENIIYWRGDALEDYDGSYYDNEQIPYAGGKFIFTNIEELYLVKGFRENPDLIEKCERFITVYARPDSININTATYPVLRAIFVDLGADKISFELSDKLAKNVVDFRNGYDDQEATGDDSVIDKSKIKTVIGYGLSSAQEKDWVANQVFPFTAKSDVFRIEVSAELSNSKIEKQITAVVDRRQKPVEIIYWYET